jgi:hypothetical protein
LLASSRPSTDPKAMAKNWQLEAEGYRAIVQAWDFTAGRD